MAKKRKILKITKKKKKVLGIGAAVAAGLAAAGAAFSVRRYIKNKKKAVTTVNVKIKSVRRAVKKAVKRKVKKAVKKKAVKKKAGKKR